MFLGHAGVALAVKKTVPGVSLGTTLLAAFWLDMVWPVLLFGAVHFAARRSVRSAASLAALATWTLGRFGAAGFWGFMAFEFLRMGVGRMGGLGRSAPHTVRIP